MPMLAGADEATLPCVGWQGFQAARWARLHLAKPSRGYMFLHLL